MPTGRNCETHVVFFAYHFPSSREPGNARRWVEARLLQMAGYHVTVVTSQVNYLTGTRSRRDRRSWCTEEITHGMRVLRVWTTENYRRSVASRLLNYFCFTLLAGAASIIRAERARYVFAGTEPIFMIPIVRVVCHLKRASLILDEGDLYPETAIALGVTKPSPITTLLAEMMRRVRLKSHRILAATPGIHRYLLAQGVSPERVHLLYNADPFLDEDLRIVDPDAASLSAWTGKTFLVVYAGGLGQSNDIETLIRAAAELRDLPTLAVVIIGAGEQVDAYQRLCAEHAISNVFFHSAVSRRCARQLLAQADICVQLLRDHPHFQMTLPSKVFDYHALGIPTLFAGRGDTEALLKESGGGITVRSQDPISFAGAVRKLYRDSELRRELGTRARRWSKANVSVARTVAFLRAARVPPGPAAKHQP